MSRNSAFKGTLGDNARPWVTLAPDGYIKIQGETSVVTCGECKKTMDINKYLTGFSTEGSVDSPPGSATINLSIPDNAINDFYIEGELAIITMMEVEIFAKGYYTIGGMPQYYRIFWGVIVNVTKNWSNGVTTVSISCKDILYWWEKTNITLNPAFITPEGSSTGNFNLWCNQFAGMNPYTVIIALARTSMGDFSITAGSFKSYKPEIGNEQKVVGAYARDIMAYWQLKFGNIWNSLVLYGTSGKAYSFVGDSSTSPLKLSASIFASEASSLNPNEATSHFKLQPQEVAAFKIELAKAAEISFFQDTTQSKLSVAMTAKNQILYEFFCDNSGDIVFKPPFYNINVIPNKPVSWINDFEIIDDSINDSEAEIITHMTSSGNAFGGVMDPGINDDFTTPRTGVIDWHLLKRYGWRRQDWQCEWAGDPEKLFWFLVDYMDRVNSKRKSGNFTIPMRPELRMGFPVWVPHYDSFFYVTNIAHNYSVGGQATTVITVSSKRSKFIAPKNIGTIVRDGNSPPKKTHPAATSGKNANLPKGSAGYVPSSYTSWDRSYKVEFKQPIGQTSGLGCEDQQDGDEPLVLRDPNTGKQLGYPNVVMVYRTTLKDQTLAKSAAENHHTGSHAKNVGSKGSNKALNNNYKNPEMERDVYKQLQNSVRAQLLSRIRNHRYEFGMTNAGLYDYAHDVSGDFKELTIVPITSIKWGSGSKVGSDYTGLTGKGSSDQDAADAAARTEYINIQLSDLKYYLKKTSDKAKSLAAQQKVLQKQLNTSSKQNKKDPKPTEPAMKTQDEINIGNTLNSVTAELNNANEQIKSTQGEIDFYTKSLNDFSTFNPSKSEFDVIVRPVSDEFGFEVIGHNAYGRGVFIDRGEMNLKGTGDANAVRIQFAPVGGMISTDSPTLKNSGAGSYSYAQKFEQMQPDDWSTGGSYTGGSTTGSNASNGTNSASTSTNTTGSVTLTNAATYSSAINSTIDGLSGAAVFIEADMLRKSVTLGELQPTVKSQLDDVGFPKCACGLSNFNWFSVLPRSVVQKILAPSTTSANLSNTVIWTLTGYIYKNPETGVITTDPIYYQYVDDNGKSVQYTYHNTKMAIYSGMAPDGTSVGTQYVESVDQVSVSSTSKQIVSGGTTQSDPVQRTDLQIVGGLKSDAKTNISIGQTNSADFFTQLKIYLNQLFTQNYADNASREKDESGEALNIQAITTGPESTNYINPSDVLGNSGGSLFDQASQGSESALNALKNQANFGFGQTKQALSELNSTAARANQVMNQAINGQGTSVFINGQSVQTDNHQQPSNAPQIQPYTPPIIKPDVATVVMPVPPPLSLNGNSTTSGLVPMVVPKVLPPKQ